MVSVIILAYNRCAEALLTIQKVKDLRTRLPFDLEIMVVDNASVDGTSKELALKHPDVTLVSRNVNSGVAGWNDGFRVAANKYLLVLDDDSHVENGLEEAVQYLEEQPEVGILGFNIVDQELKGDPMLDPEEAWKHMERISGFIGCGALIRKEVYDRIGGFAEWLFIYTHEFDYSIRALNAGYLTVFFEKCNVVHRASKINRTNRRLRIFGIRNEMAIVYKHFTKSRFKYLSRIFFNNLKFIKREGILSGYYIFLGTIAFLKFRHTLKRTPVSAEVQDFYSKNFWSTKPVIGKRYYSIF